MWLTLSPDDFVPLYSTRMIASNRRDAALGKPPRPVVVRGEVAGADCWDRGGSKFFRDIAIHFPAMQKADEMERNNKFV